MATVGDNKSIIFINDEGAVVKSSATVGSDSVPVHLKSGAIEISGDISGGGSGGGSSDEWAPKVAPTFYKQDYDDTLVGDDQVPSSVTPSNAIYVETGDVDRDTSKTYYIGTADPDTGSMSYREAIDSDYNEDGSFVDGTIYYETVKDPDCMIATKGYVDAQDQLMVDDLSKVIDAKETELTSKIVDCNTTIIGIQQTVEEKLTTFESAVDGMQDSVSASSTFMTTNGPKIIANESAISTLQDSVKTNTDNIRSNATNISTNTSDISSLKTDVANNTTSIGTNTSDITSLTKDFNEFVRSYTLMLYTGGGIAKRMVQWDLNYTEDETISAATYCNGRDIYKKLFDNLEVGKKYRIVCIDATRSVDNINRKLPCTYALGNVDGFTENYYYRKEETGTSNKHSPVFFYTDFTAVPYEATATTAEVYGFVNIADVSSIGYALNFYLYELS